MFWGTTAVFRRIRWVYKAQPSRVKIQYGGHVVQTRKFKRFVCISRSRFVPRVEFTGEVTV